jgi:branched-chain amino acid transport system substrate-binding protein
LVGLSLVFAVALLAVACGGGGQNGLKGKREVAIAFVGAKTGPNQTFGLNFRDGARLAIEEENEGNNGDLTVRLREFDTAGDVTQARSVISQFVGDPSVVGVVGPVFTGETNRLIPDLQQARLVMIGASAVDKDLPSSLASRAVYHRIVGDDDLQSSGIAEYLSSVERPAAVAYVHDGSDYGKQLAVNTERKASAKGVRSATIEVIDPKSGDFSAAIAKVRASGADAVFYGGQVTEAALLKRKLVEQGATVRFVSGEAALDKAFVDNALSSNAEGARLTCACNLPLETSTGALRDFYNQYKQKAGRDPGLYSAEGYDAVRILIRGIKAGNEKRETLLRFVEEELGRYEGISKAIEFEPDGNLRVRTFMVYEVRSGKISVLQSLTLGPSTGTTNTTLGATTTSTASRTPVTRRRTTTTTVRLPTSTTEGTTTTTTTTP